MYVFRDISPHLFLPHKKDQILPLICLSACVYPCLAACLFSLFVILSISTPTELFQ